MKHLPLAIQRDHFHGCGKCAEKAIRWSASGTSAMRRNWVYMNKPIPYGNLQARKEAAIGEASWLRAQYERDALGDGEMNE